MDKCLIWPKERPGKKMVEKFWMKDRILDRNHQKKYKVTTSL